MPRRYRDYALALLLLAGCGLLLVILLSEWAYYRLRQADLKTRLAEKVEVHLKTASVERERYELPGLEGYPATVERPLFMENRRPVEEDTGQPEPATVEKAPLDLKLMGIVSSPGQAMGLFVDAKGKYARKHKNDTMGSWKLVELAPGKAILEQDGVREELKLFMPKPKKKTGPAFPGAQPPGQPVLPPGSPPQPVQVNPEFQPPMDNEQPNPNEPVDDSAVPPPEPANDQ